MATKAEQILEKNTPVGHIKYILCTPPPQRQSCDFFTAAFAMWKG